MLESSFFRYKLESPYKTAVVLPRHKTAKKPRKGARPEGKPVKKSAAPRKRSLYTKVALELGLFKIMSFRRRLLLSYWNLLKRSQSSALETLIQANIQKAINQSLGSLLKAPPSTNCSQSCKENQPPLLLHPRSWHEHPQYCTP